MSYWQNLLHISLEASPWLLLGFLAAGAIKLWIPEVLLQRWLGGNGVWPVTKAALIGAPLPLCSCGVLPAALGLRRSGASKSATLSFLIATPETGVDSIALSYVLLGPVMAVIRPVAAITSAIATGLLAGQIEDSMRSAQSPACASDCGCSQKPLAAVVQPGFLTQARGEGSDSGASGTQSKWKAALGYALVDMVDDLLLWLALGLGLAALILTLVPPMAMAQWGSGLPAMLLMLLIGIPMYICATASTPVAAAMLVAGISPGTVLVFLLAGPATNMATLGLLRKEMGTPTLWIYLVGVCVSSILLGLLTDLMVSVLGWDIQAQINATAETLPEWVEIGAAVVLLVAAGNVLLRRLRRLLPK